MSKLLVAALALAGLAFLAHRATRGEAAPADGAPATERSAPARRLDNARGAAQRIEAEQQQRTDDAERLAH